MNVVRAGMCDSDWELAARILTPLSDHYYLVKRRVLPKRLWFYFCPPGELPEFHQRVLWNQTMGNFPYGWPVEPD